MVSAKKTANCVLEALDMNLDVVKGHCRRIVDSICIYSSYCRFESITCLYVPNIFRHHRFFSKTCPRTNNIYLCNIPQSRPLLEWITIHSLYKEESSQQWENFTLITFIAFISQPLYHPEKFINIILNVLQSQIYLPILLDK